MSRVEAIISDFGGVLTSPLLESFAGLMESSGISLESVGKAMVAIAEREGSNPLFELETGRITEAAFMDALSEQLSVDERRRGRARWFRRALLPATQAE